MSDKTRRTDIEINNELSKVARFIRSKRKELGYSQKEFANRVGIGLRFLRDFEQGKKTVRMDKVEEILSFLGHELVPLPIKRVQEVDK